VAVKTFEKIVYREPRLHDTAHEIERFVGIDTEAYSDGKPFLICSSESDTWTPKDIPACFFSPSLTGADFVFYNIKYDSGAILSCFLDREELLDLWKYNKVTTDDGYIISYVPHKFLSIRRNKETARFWDIAQYYRMGLDSAAQLYLNKSKIEVETKSFSKSYVKKNLSKLKKYCIRDAELTRDLAIFFQKKLKEFGIKSCALYSSASLSFSFFHEKIPIIDIWNIYKYNPELVRFAHEAYQGGKFECSARGSFDQGYEYDIVSAYPWEMYNLPDIRTCKIERSRSVMKNADFALLRCSITIPSDLPSCHGALIKGVRVYCRGWQQAYLTLNEYLYLRDGGADIVIHDGFWIYGCPQAYPYRKIIKYLFSIKDKYRKTDKVLYQITKIMLNGYYGKMVQLTPMIDQDNDDNEYFKAGAAWNPIYAGVITANTRIRICKMQKYLKSDCLAVHTDSLISLRKLENKDFKKIDGKRISDKLGDWKLECEGKGLIIAAGLYDMADHTAVRGVELKNDLDDNHRGSAFSWREMLSASPNKKQYSYDQLRVISWTQACAWDRIEEINKFENFPKKINLDCDTKRVWQCKKLTGKKLLSGLEYGDVKEYQK
jgi:hypothetical protein